MAERKEPHGRGRIIEKFREQQKKKGQEEASPRPSEIPKTAVASEMSKASPGVRRTSLGRGEFVSKLRAELSKTKSDDGGGDGSSSSSSISHPSEPTSIESGVKSGDSTKAPVESISSTLEGTHLDDFSDKYVKKSKVGEYGEKTNFATNYVYLKTDPAKPVFQYEVLFTPVFESASYRYRILYEQFPGKREMLCFDGQSLLLTPEKITDTESKFSALSPADRSPVVMTIRYKKKMAAKECAKLYNILFKNCSRALNLKILKNKVYDPTSAFKIPQHKLEIWPGFITSIEEFDGGVQLRCDTNHKLLRTDTAYDVLAYAVNRNPDNYKALAEKDLIGECVITKYNNNTYRIDDIEWTKTPASKFLLSNGSEMTFLQYYKKQYDIDIMDVEQPLLVHRAKSVTGLKSKLICLVPELCCMTGLTDKLRSDIKVKKDIARYIQVTPAQKTLAFKQFLRNIRSNDQARAILTRWGLTIADDFVQVTGRNLGSERVRFGGERLCQPESGQWSAMLQSSSVYRSVDIVHWLFLFPKKESRVAHSFLSMCQKVGPGLGIEIEAPLEVTLVNDTTEGYIQALGKYINENTQIVVCLFSTQREDRYSAVKKFCCKNMPVPSQVVTATTLGRQDRMRIVVQNIALQMNNKLGGASWSIAIPFKNTMICGVDTYHDKCNAKNSVGGFVASLNSDYTEWFSRTNFQGPKQELMDGLIQSFTASLNYYIQRNNLLPQRIVVYRDGVSNDQFRIVLEFEVKQFLEACHRFNHDYRPKFTFVIVKKRIGTKFFDMKGNSENVGNPRPGSVIDHTISTKNCFDFYLVSQWVRQGTATPCHYVVVYDNSDILPDHIQRLTYKFCHLYYNWPGTVRVPAPCLYAHKLAYLVGQNVRTQPDERLENKLYYL